MADLADYGFSEAERFQMLVSQTWMLRHAAQNSLARGAGKTMANPHDVMAVTDALLAFLDGGAHDSSPAQADEPRVLPGEGPES